MVFEKVRDIVVEQLGVEEDEVTMESSFIEDLGADSLDIVELIMALEEEFELEIPEVEAEKMIDLAISSGVNYIDTAYPYHNGDSEPFVGRVLDKYPRDSYFLATKLPMWKIVKE